MRAHTILSSFLIGSSTITLNYAASIPSRTSLSRSSSSTGWNEEMLHNNTMLNIRDGGDGTAYLQTGQDAMVGAVNFNSIQDEVFPPTYPPNPNGPQDCITSATLDAVTSIVYYTDNIDFTTSVPVVNSDSANLPSGCNDVVVQMWLNVKDTAVFSQWKLDVKEQNSFSGLSQQVANEMITGETIQTCSLGFVGSDSDGCISSQGGDCDGWWGGIVAGILGLELGDEYAPNWANGWPTSDIISDCGGVVDVVQ